MLVLTRKTGQSVIINGDLVIKICSIEGRNAVRIGVEAPRDKYEVLREELCAAKEEDHG